MALPEFCMRQLLEAGAHFGHQTHRWNPKMERFIFGSRSNIHIIDLSQTMPLLHQALVKISDVVAGVYVVEPEIHGDQRGLFIETYRRAWFPQGREMVQANRADRRAADHRAAGVQSQGARRAARGHVGGTIGRRAPLPAGGDDGLLLRRRLARAPGAQIERL